MNFTKGNLVSTAYRTRKTDNWSFKYYRYDERGRVIRMWNTIDGLGNKNITYHQYNSQDQIVQLNYGYETEYKRYSYYYDFGGRLGIVNYANAEPSLDKSAADINFTNYTYNPNSLIDFQFFNSYQLQNQYNYDSRNWIISMNNIEGLFGFTNTYYKNGNLNTQLLFGTYKDYYPQNNYNLNYYFTYDNSNRLLEAINLNQGNLTYSVFNTYDKDGNITTLKRYGDNNTVADDFQYQYFPNTNKLRLVSGALDQYNYDLNGNTILDDLNSNYNIKYDHRNLITELYHKAVEGRAYVYATRYYYDESGNRVRKLVYLNSQTDPPPITDWNNPGNGWTLLNNEFYVKGADGKDLATYQGNVLDEWFVWGIDLTGKIKGDKRYFYYKDHLGSIRAVADNTGTIVAAYDYDAWGYPLENRNYNGDSIKFKYTGKELDKESFYDYFGARYYDARVGRWGQVEPLYARYLQFSPYCYVLNNPLLFIDRLGADIDLSRVPQRYRQELINGLSLITGLNLFEENGFLKYQLDSKGDGSEIASELIISGIESESILQVWITNKGSEAEIGGSWVKIDPAQIQFYIDNTSSDLNKNTLGWGMVFIHEFLHTSLGGSLEDPHVYGVPGDVENKVNEIRSQLGSDYGIRASYKSILLDDGFKYIPFSEYSEKLVGKGEIPNSSFVKSLNK